MKATETVLFTAHVDGGARGNPGHAGIGVRIVVDDLGEVYRRADYLGRTTNNQAEYRALLHCLGVLEEMELRFGIVHSDSELLVKQISGAYRVKDAGLRPLYQQVMDLLERLEHVKVVHIPRAENSEADALANLGMDLGAAISGETDG